MKIKWLGHACFLITDSKGKTILTDPFDQSVGYKVYDGAADLVTLSHHHHDHDNTADVKGDPIIIDHPGEFNEFSIKFRGIPSFHDKKNGAERGNNILFVFDIDGYKVCHLGDLGYELSDKEIKEIGEVDILMIPVGGKYTIDATEAAKVAKSINSHYILPMHYKTAALNIPLAGVDDFVNFLGNPEIIGKNEMEIKGKLEGYNLVKILNYK